MAHVIQRTVYDLGGEIARLYKIADLIGKREEYVTDHDAAFDETLLTYIDVMSVFDELNAENGEYLSETLEKEFTAVYEPWYNAGAEGSEVETIISQMGGNSYGN
jgi:hypothetical protein